MSSVSHNTENCMKCRQTVPLGKTVPVGFGFGQHTQTVDTVHNTQRVDTVYTVSALSVHSRYVYTGMYTCSLNSSELHVYTCNSAVEFVVEVFC